MRPKGWKLDPMWIAHYQDKERRRRAHEIFLLEEARALRNADIPLLDMERMRKIQMRA